MFRCDSDIFIVQGVWPSLKSSNLVVAIGNSFTSQTQAFLRKHLVILHSPIKSLAAVVIRGSSGSDSHSSGQSVSQQLTAMQSSTHFYQQGSLQKLVLSLQYRLELRDCFSHWVSVASDSADCRGRCVGCECCSRLKG